VRASLPESQRIRERIMEKRMRKLSSIASEMSPPNLLGDVDAELTLLCWGSTFGVCREAQTILAHDGIKVNILAFRYLFPLVPETGEILSRCKRILGIEQNYTGQFTHLLTSHTGIQIKECLHKYSGEPLYAGEVVTRVREMMT
jgi:2-oxoglutarate ferredoxin oxidoreductase subunit alpha